MSSVDIELVEKLGLTKKVLGGYLGVTSQSFGQGLQATKRYLDDQRLAALYRGLESDGHTDKLVLVEQYIIDAEAFGAAVKTLRIQGGPLGKEAGSLTSNYVWFLKQTDRITEEWPMLESVISGEAPYQLIIATSDHCIKSVSHGQIARSVIESRYLAQASRPEAYQTSQGNIALVSTELDLFMPELLIPNVDPYANQPGYVHTKTVFRSFRQPWWVIWRKRCIGNFCHLRSPSLKKNQWTGRGIAGVCRI